MELMKQYRELFLEIEMLRCRLNDLYIEFRYLHANLSMNSPNSPGAIDYSKDRVIGGQVPLSIEEWTVRYDRIVGKRDTIKQEIEDKELVLKDMKRVLEKFGTTEQKVLFYKNMEGLTLKEIAAKLNLTYDYIREVHSRLKKTTKTHI